MYEKELKPMTAKNFEDLTIMKSKPVLVDLYTDWCEPCFDLEKLLVEIRDEYQDYIEVYKVDLEKELVLTDLFEVDAIPVTVMMTGGVVVKKSLGVPSKEELIEEMELDTIKDYRDRGKTYHPKRNYIPGYIVNDMSTDNPYEDPNSPLNNYIPDDLKVD